MDLLRRSREENEDYQRKDKRRKEKQMPERGENPCTGVTIHAKHAVNETVG
jgi:hypothetical protein